MKNAIFAALLAACLLGIPGYADCGQHLSDAKAALNGMKQKALSQQKLDPQASAYQIKAHIDAMSQEQCVGEMQAFLQYIQQEQQSYPDPRSNPGAYRQ